MPDTFQPKSALVTGSAKGIGAAVAIHLAHQGINVAIQYLASDHSANLVLAECLKSAPGSIVVQGDLRNEADVDRICREATEKFGEIDVLVNNVGNYLRKDLLEMSFAEWRDQLESNLYTTFLTCRQIVPRMNERKHGRVVNIGYAGSQQPFYNRKTVPYHIAKTGVNMLTRQLGALAAPHGVTVNCLGMGVIENSVRVPEDLPAGRTGSYSDVLNALDFLLSPESEYINGTQIDVSGGWLPEQIL